MPGRTHRGYAREDECQPTLPHRRQSLPEHHHGENHGDQRRDEGDRGRSTTSKGAGVIARGISGRKIAAVPLVFQMIGGKMSARAARLLVGLRSRVSRSFLRNMTL